MEYIASRLTFRFVGVVCMTRPDQWRVILSAFICNKLRDTTSNEYTLMGKHFLRFCREGADHRCVVAYAYKGVSMP